MPKPVSNASKIAKVFTDYCNRKNYQVKQSEELGNLRLDISNLSERTIAKIYNTGTMQIQGKQNSLKSEIENPQSFIGGEITEIKPRATKYDIMLPKLRTKIKESSNTLEPILEFTENPKSSIEYRAKITRNSLPTTLTQYNNGTLLLQGKIDVRDGVM